MCWKYVDAKYYSDVWTRPIQYIYDIAIGKTYLNITKNNKYKYVLKLIYNT